MVVCECVNVNVTRVRVPSLLHPLTITLPLSAPGRVPVAPDMLPPSPKTEPVPLRVLVVDDELIVRKLLMRSLAAEGNIDCVAVADGQAGIDLLLEEDAARETTGRVLCFDVIILDLVVRGVVCNQCECHLCLSWQMPVLDGFGFLKEIKKHER
jgi:CheY-like chemotaxis protein